MIKILIEYNRLQLPTMIRPLCRFNQLDLYMKNHRVLRHKKTIDQNRSFFYSRRSSKL